MLKQTWKRTNIRSFSTVMKTFHLQYTYVADMETKRTAHRQNHIDLLKSFHEKGQLVAAGPFSPPVEAVYLFRGSDKSVVEEFISKDPYVKNNLVVTQKINEWNIVVGTVLQQ